MRLRCGPQSKTLSRLSGPPTCPPGFGLRQSSGALVTGLRWTTGEAMFRLRVSRRETPGKGENGGWPMTDVCSNRRSFTQVTLTAHFATLPRGMLVPAKSQRRPNQDDRRLPRRTYELSLSQFICYLACTLPPQFCTETEKLSACPCAMLTQHAGISRSVEAACHNPSYGRRTTR
jgi:hypothetical protein